MPRSVAPENFRNIPYKINGISTGIIGMARPDRGNHDISESITFVKEHYVDVIIAFDWKEDYEKESNRQGISYINQQIPDFDVPSLEQCDEIYRMVNEYVADGKKVAMHCGAGHGRTGTVLAALKLRELLEDNPELKEHQEVTSMLFVGHYGGKQFIPCTPLVKEAVLEIRGAKDSKGSVEISKQIDFLCQYQAHLISQRNKEGKIPNEAFSDHHDVLLIAKEVIIILECQKNKSSFFDRIALTLQINSMKKRLDNCSKGKYFLKSHKKFNSLIWSILDTQPNQIYNSGQKERLLSLQAQITDGQAIEKATIRDKMIGLSVFLYKATTDFFMRKQTKSTIEKPIINSIGDTKVTIDSSYRTIFKNAFTKCASGSAGLTSASASELTKITGESGCELNSNDTNCTPKVITAEDNSNEISMNKIK